MDLPVYLEQVVRNFNRYQKDRLRTDQRQQSRKLVTVHPGHLAAGETACVC